MVSHRVTLGQLSTSLHFGTDTRGWLIVAHQGAVDLRFLHKAFLTPAFSLLKSLQRHQLPFRFLQTPNIGLKWEKQASFID